MSFEPNLEQIAFFILLAACMFFRLEPLGQRKRRATRKEEQSQR
jgi:hypothetical protein